MTNNRRGFSQYWVYPVSVLFFLLTLFLVEYSVLESTKGMFIYPYDEAYIRMAIGKNLAHAHYWGLTNGVFAPASSSLIWPLILALFYALLGNHAMIPFVLNLVAALALLFALYRWLKRTGLPPTRQLALLVIIQLLIPLPVLVMLGMEHSLQILVSFLFIYQFCEWLNGDEGGRPGRKSMPWKLYLYGFVGVAVRYEGLFLVAIACLFLLWRSNWISSLFLLLISILPVVAFGIYSVNRGGYFLPNSILLRGLPIPIDYDSMVRFLRTASLDRVFYPAATIGNIATERLLIILPLSYLWTRENKEVNSKYLAILIFCLGIVLLHVILANSLLYNRYEAYLLACSLVVPALLLLSAYRQVLRSWKRPLFWVGLWTMLFLFYPILSRAWYAFKDAGTACKYEYQRNYMAAMFLSRYYGKDAVYVDEIGMAAYAGSTRIVDLTSGLGNMDLMHSIEGGYFRPEYIQYQASLAKPVIALVSERGFPQWVLSHWKKVASWRTRDIVATRDPVISFYAVEDAAAPALRSYLKEFQSVLPAGVGITFY